MNQGPGYGQRSRHRHASLAGPCETPGCLWLVGREVPYYHDRDRRSIAECVRDRPVSRS